MTNTLTLTSSLNPTQHQVLRTLARSSEPLRVDEIGELLDLHTNTVRAALNVLQEKELVKRSPQAASGRGRPSWLYRATVTTDTAQIANEFAGFTKAVAEQISLTTQDPMMAAKKLGQTWGQQVLDRGIPAAAEPEDGTLPPPSWSDSPGENAANLQIFFSELGFEGRPGETDSEINLHQCPLTTPGQPRPEIICQIHSGMVNKIVTELSGGQWATALEPDAGPGFCQVRLLMRKDSTL